VHRSSIAAHLCRNLSIPAEYRRCYSNTIKPKPSGRGSTAAGVVNDTILPANDPLNADRPRLGPGFFDASSASGIATSTSILLIASGRDEPLRIHE
jgi:hypothetical protein